MDPKTKLFLDELTKEARKAGGDVLQISSATPSMLGSPYAGNTVMVMPKPEYAVGDDVVFRAGKNRNILHRVTHVKPGFVFTKGTFNQMGDGWIPLESVIGKVERVVRRKER